MEHIYPPPPHPKFQRHHLKNILGARKNNNNLAPRTCDANYSASSASSPPSASSPSFSASSSSSSTSSSCRRFNLGENQNYIRYPTDQQGFFDLTQRLELDLISGSRYNDTMKREIRTRCGGSQPEVRCIEPDTGRKYDFSYHPLPFSANSCFRSSIFG